MAADRPFLDTQEIAEYLGIHEKQVYTLVHERGLPATKITGKWLFPRHLVDRWIDATVVNPPPALPFMERVRDLLLIAGSDDPLLVKFIGLFRERHPGVLVLQSRAGSSDGILALKKGLVHIACIHLVDTRGGYSADHLHETLGEEIAVVTFSKRTQGLLLEPGNPQGIRTLAHALGKGLRWALREVGTGTRALLDREADREGVEGAVAFKYFLPAQSHMEAAFAVRDGHAQAALGIEAAAMLTGCHFIPLRQERFDLVVRQEHFFLPQIQGFIALLEDSAFREAAAALRGYDLTDSGKLAG